MRDNSHPLRRVGRPASYAQRVRHGNQQALSEMWSTTLGAVYAPKRGGETTSMRRKVSLNWRVTVERGQVLAIEPDKDFEHVFEGGGDPFWAAVEFAAAQIKEA